MTSWLEQVTNKSAAWWMATVQELIRQHTRPSDDPNHGETDEKAWAQKLVEIVVDGLPVTGEPYDGNMRVAAITSQVLALWYLRVQKAKICDPRRPLDSRQKAYTRWMDYATALFFSALDEREDAAYFPGQSWSLPFDPAASGGDFV